MNKNAFTVYTTLYKTLKKQIKSGYFQPDQCIPSEIQLARQFRISRTSVRIVLKSLQDEGLLYKMQGKGTFVSANKNLKNKVPKVKTVKVLIHVTKPYTSPASSFNYYPGLIIEGLNESCPQDCRLWFEYTEGKPEEEIFNLERLKNDEVKGLILVHY